MHRPRRDQPGRNARAEGRAEERCPLFSPRGFELLSDLWVKVGWSQKYSYSFTWFGRPLIQSMLFALAIAVGITPQLLPAVVSTSLATGSRRLAKLKVLVKRLVCIEDLGDMDVLVTDKTGTLTLN